MTEFKPTWFLAQSDPHRTGSAIPTPKSGTKEIRWFDDMALVMGIALLLMLALAIWAKFFRKSSDKKSGKNDKFRSVPDATGLSDQDSESQKRRKKRRRRRRDHRPRNPTLAETGGLPEVKEHDEQDS
jgi:hypothetical protein